MGNQEERHWTRWVATLIGFLTISCVEGEVAKPTYELGEAGVLVVRNDSVLPMAIGGCNPSLYHERLPGRWVPDPFLRPACAFFTMNGETHTLTHYQLIPAGGSLEIGFFTGWLSSTPGIMRVSQRVSTLCESPDVAGEPITCHGVEQLLTEPIVVFEPGTSDVFESRSGEPLNNPQW